VDKVRLVHGNLEVEYFGTGQAVETTAHLALDRPIGRVVNRGAAQRVLHGQLGNLLGAFKTDSTSLAVSYIYGPFGEILAESGDTPNFIHRYNGKEQDKLTNLSYYGYRYFDPYSLSWTQADPLFRFVPDLAWDQPRRSNLYVFSLSNPLRYLDVDGRCAGAFCGGPLKLADQFRDFGTDPTTAIAIINVVDELVSGAVSGMELTAAFLTPCSCRSDNLDAAKERANARHQAAEQRGAARLERAADESASGSAGRVTVSKSRYPESAAHIEKAQAAGKPSQLTIDRGGASTRRKEAMSGTKTTPQKDRDEYPPAMFKEGGAGASVKPISPSDNRGAGSCIGAQCRTLPDGSKVDIEVIE
jgi:RHS repeat-associated protein